MKTSNAIIVVALFMLAFFLIGSFPFYFYGFPPTANEFGDSFGFMNALMASAAAFAVAYAISLQIEELKESREAGKRSEAAQERSDKRLASTAALNALESLRMSAQSKFNSSNSSERMQARIADAKISLLVSGILKDLGIGDFESLRKPNIIAVEMMKNMIEKSQTQKTVPEKEAFLNELKEHFDQWKDEEWLSKYSEQCERIISSPEKYINLSSRDQVTRQSSNRSIIVNGGSGEFYNEIMFVFNQLFNQIVSDIAPENSLFPGITRTPLTASELNLDQVAEGSV